VLLSLHLYAQKVNNIPINSIKDSKNVEIESGNKMFLNGNYYGALNTYMEGIKRNEFIAYFNMGVTYYVIGDYKKAEECFINALKINSESIEAELNLAYTYVMLGKFNQAEKIMNKYINKIKSPNFYVNLANLYLENGKMAKAYFYINNALEMKPESFYIQLSLANYFAAVGDKSGSIQILERLNPEGYFENFNIARIYFNLEDYIRSNDYLKKASIYSETAEVYDLMAKNYALLNERSMQTVFLKKLVDIDDSQINKVNYAVGLFCMKAKDEAFNYLKDLIKSERDQILFKHLYYDFLITENNVNDAKTYVENLYNSSMNSENLYIYIKHLVFSGNRNDLMKARQLIYSKANDNYINLAHILLNIKDRNYSEGLRRISNISYAMLNDFQKEEYDIIKALLYLNSDNFMEASESARLIPYYRSEYFWINFAGNWNSREFSSMHKILKGAHYSCLNTKKTKKIKLKIKPSLVDMNLSFTFYDKPIDIIDTILYPIFMDANEVLQILRFGSKLAESNNLDTALTTLSRSLAFTKAIDKNNKAVFNIIKSNYEKALKFLIEANNALENNPVILFNLGLAYKYIGNVEEALKYFDMSISSNRYFYPASIAKAALFAKAGRIIESNNILENIYYSFSTHVDDIKHLPLYIKYTEYLAGVVLGNYEDIVTKINADDKTQYTELILAIIDYLNGEKTESLRKIRNNKAFRSSYIHDFLTLYNGGTSLITDNPNDRVYKFTTYFIKTLKGQKPIIRINRNDKYEVKESIYYKMFYRLYNEALNEIRQLSDLDPQAPILYEATLYYFMIIDDVVNSEGAYNSLMRYSSDNVFSRYYKLLYLLYNQDLKNIENDINSFKSDYPSSIKGYILYAIYTFITGDLEGLQESINFIFDNYSDYQKRINVDIHLREL
jgi:tetratricopeptide (TPR) repeat protein